MDAVSPSDPKLPFDAEADERRPRRVDLDGEVSLKFKEHPGFFEERPANLSPGGMFIRSTSPQPPGTTFDFELILQGEKRVVHGIGEVAWVREEDEGFDRPPGMGVRFLSLEPESRELIDRLVAERLQEEREHPPPPGSLVAEPAPEEEPAPEAEPAPGTETPQGVPPPPDPFRPPDPARYAYARSYQGAAIDRDTRRRRPLLLVLLALFLLVILGAGISLLFPDTALRLLLGERDAAEEPAQTAASGPEAGGNRPAEPVEPVAPADRPEAEAGGERDPEAEEEMGFFEPPAEAAPEPPPAPAPAPAPAPDPPPAAPEPAPEPQAFTRVLNVLWEERAEEVVVTVVLDGGIEEWDYEVSRLAVPPPRVLVVIRGVEEAFPRSEIPVGTGLVERIRLGFHPERRESELHVVVDLASADAEVVRSEAEGRELRLHLGPSAGGAPGGAEPR